MRSSDEEGADDYESSLIEQQAEDGCQKPKAQEVQRSKRDGRCNPASLIYIVIVVKQGGQVQRIQYLVSSYPRFMV